MIIKVCCDPQPFRFPRLLEPRTFLSGAAPMLPPHTVTAATSSHAAPTLPPCLPQAVQMLLQRLLYAACLSPPHCCNAALTPLHSTLVLPSMIFLSYVKMHFSYLKSKILRRWLNIPRNYVHFRTFFTLKTHSE